MPTLLTGEMMPNQRLTIAIAAVAIIIAVIVVIVLLNSANSTPNTTVASAGSPTATQNIDTERTQFYGGVTASAQVLEMTNQAANHAATDVSMQGTMGALSTAQAAQGQPQQPTIVGAPPQQPLSTAAPLIIAATSQPLQQPTVDTISQVGDWTDAQNINISSGSITLGDSAGWVVFQVWDGQSAATTVHGVIEPGRKIIIPARLKGTYWTVTHITYEAVTARALTMRDEALQQGTAGTAPPILYIGNQNHVPQGYSIQIPSGWTVE